MTYKIKPEFAHLWGEDVNEDTIITEEDLDMIARGWGKSPEELKEQLDVFGPWYAVLKDEDDNDLGTGSYDLNEALKMARTWRDDPDYNAPAPFIAVIDNSNMDDPFCIDEIRDLDE